MAEEKESRTNYYLNKSVEQVLQEMSVDLKKGLSEEEVDERRQQYGYNVLPKKGKKSPVKLFLKQFKDFLILILFLAAGISIYAGQMANAYIIFGVILFNAIMGFVQEYKAEKAVEAIKKMVKKKAVVIRNGEQKTITAREIVPGDLIVLQEGQTVPADCRLVEIKNLRITEAALTGEPGPVSKQTEAVKKDTELANRKNMAWKGTHVVKGSGLAVVITTGKETELGRIAVSLEEMEKTESNFRKKTKRLAKIMASIAMITSIIVFCLGYFYRDFEFNTILLVTIATLVSSIPEGLPVVISIVLAIGANRMAKRNAIIREFTATEVLGSVSTILTDKTGTITQSILTVKRLFGADQREFNVSGQGYQLAGRISENGEDEEMSAGKKEPILTKMLLISAYCNNATIRKTNRKEGDLSENEEAPSEEDGKHVEVSGDPTEISLKVLAEKSKLQEIEPYQDVEVLDDIPFNSEQRFRATLVRYENKKELLVVGAPEKVLEMSDEWLTEEGPENMEDHDREVIQDKNDEWAGQAIRVLALAYKEMPEDQEEIETQDVQSLTWAGLTGIIDPPRQEVKKAVDDCHRAGIRVIMVTGDHQRTAAAIAEEVGIIKNKNGEGKYPDALTEKELKDLDDEEFDEMIEHVSVFARVSPATKLRIAERLQEKGALIAMTGDGVNDAPALKKADVGIAMGKKGTDVAKDAAHIVLSDDNFASIVNAIREGRIVFKNVKSTSYFLLTTNFASTSTLIFSLLLGMPIPLMAAQILWVNIVTDGIMDVAKSTEPGHGDMMKRKPIKKNERILTWDIMPYLFIMAAVMVTLALLTFNHYLPQGLEMARTGAFLVIAMTQVFNVFNMRDIRKSVFKIGLFSNKWINLAFVASIVLQFAVVKIPFLQSAFGFQAISILDFLVITGISTMVLWIGELYKLARRKFFSKGDDD